MSATIDIGTTLIETLRNATAGGDAAALLELRDGKIIRQVGVQAWDE